MLTGDLQVCAVKGLEVLRTNVRVIVLVFVVGAGGREGTPERDGSAKPFTRARELKATLH